MINGYTSDKKSMKRRTKYPMYFTGSIYSISNNDMLPIPFITRCHILIFSQILDS